MTLAGTTRPPASTPPTAYVGRFAPSPTGALHFGSLVAAVGSFLEARRHHGRWLLRMEDLDPPRVVQGAADEILETLRRFQFHWDGEVLYQSDRTEAYADALRMLDARGHLFPCACTRSELPAGAPYPGTCRNGLPPGREGRAVRVRVDDRPISFQDRLQGPQSERLDESCGDFVVRRADGLFAYQLAVVVDDAYQGVNDVVRGADLLDSTPRQRYLQTLLGVPHPETLHLPLVMGPDGHKLGKRFASDPITQRKPLDALGDALDFLGHTPPKHSNLASRWAWAQAHWDPKRIPGTGHPAARTV